MNNSISTPETKQFADAVLKGLSLKKKKLPSWLIFDTRGSEIFKQITELENYHPSRCELEIFNTHKATLSKIFSDASNHLVELGSGDGDKTMILIEQLLADGVELHYTPIDISKGAINNLINTLNKKFPSPKLNATGLVADYFEGLATIEKAKKMVLFLGVTLNNMDIPDAKAFLKKLRGTLLNDDYLLIGFDLMKNPKLLHQSYNDELFEKFNLHILDRINDTLGANFDKKLFVQQGHYNPHTHAVESFLYSTCKQTIHIEALDKSFDFASWETMQTEQSYKYSIEDIKSLALESGFKISENFYDSKNYFVDSLWQAD
jgi:L-histidine Nalpha-methyltransferase